MNVNDLDKIMAQDEEDAVIPVYQKNGDPYLALDGTQSTITVVGVESKQYQEAKRAHQKRLFSIMKKTAGQVLDPAIARQEDIKLLAAAVKGWHGWDDGKAETKCTPDNIKSLLRVPHIFDQVKAGVDGHADFFTARSGS